MPTCLIGMSGGVDSSVAAFLLLEQGYDCIGVTMRLCDTAPVDGAENPVEDAQAVCQRLGIPHHVLDLRTAFDQHVMGPFAEEYEAGRTPNPCICCNRTMKFEAMWQFAKTLGCDCMATGHYAQIVERDGGLRLQKAADPEKDQTYVLYFRRPRALGMQKNRRVRISALFRMEIMEVSWNGILANGMPLGILWMPLAGYWAGTRVQCDIPWASGRDWESPRRPGSM